MLRLSNSSLDKYNLCPRLFKYRYIDKIYSNTRTSALVFGSAIDESIEYLIKNHDLEKSKEIFENNMVKNFKEGLHLYKKDFDWNTLTNDNIDQINSMPDGEKKDFYYAKSSLIGKGLVFLDKFYSEFILEIEELIDAQVEVNAKKDIYSIIGFIDFIFKMKDGSIVLVDLKTSSGSYSRKKLDESQQLHLYHFLLKLMKKRGDYNKIIPKDIAYLVLRKDFNTKGQMREIQFLRKEPNEEFSLQIMNMFDNLIDNIETKSFPKTEKKFNCTKQFGKKCDYYEICVLNKDVKDVKNLYRKEK